MNELPILPPCPCSGSDGGFTAVTLLIMAAGIWLAVWSVRRWKEQGVPFMNTAGKIGIVVALVIAVAGVLVAKKVKFTPGDQPAPVASETSPDSANQSPTQLPRLVDLGAGKCIPCKLMKPILDELKKEYAAAFEVQFVDVWENPDAGEKYGIRIIPTQIFFDPSGKELFRHEGFYSKEDILKKWKELGYDVTS